MSREASRRKALATTVLLLGIVVPCEVSRGEKSPSTPIQVTTAESWQKEFEEVCSKTQDAMTFSVDELKIFIQRCNALQPQIEKLDETRKKVYSRRLQQCRGLFAYVLESKQKDKK
jgi:hypothetical protein